MLEPADILIVVEPEGPEHLFFAERVCRDLQDWKYKITGAAPFQATLKVAWDDGIWTLTYNNQAQIFKLQSLGHLQRVLHEDRILAYQPNMPPGRLRPFARTIRE
jgi:hypothetical protein